MIRIISSLLAKASAILLIATTVVWLFRLAVDKGVIKESSKMFQFTKFLQNYHKIMGKLLFICALIHGILSSARLLSLNYGTYSFVAIFALSISCAFHKEDKDKVWKIIHRLISIAAFALFVIHIVDIA